MILFSFALSFFFFRLEAVCFTFASLTAFSLAIFSGSAVGGIHRSHDHYGAATSGSAHSLATDIVGDRGLARTNNAGVGEGGGSQHEKRMASIRRTLDAIGADLRFDEDAKVLTQAQIMIDEYLTGTPKFALRGKLEALCAAAIVAVARDTGLNTSVINFDTVAAATARVSTTNTGKKVDRKSVYKQYTPLASFRKRKADAESTDLNNKWQKRNSADDDVGGSTLQPVPKRARSNGGNATEVISVGGAETVVGPSSSRASMAPPLSKISPLARAAPLGRVPSKTKHKMSAPLMRADSVLDSGGVIMRSNSTAQGTNLTLQRTGSEQGQIVPARSMSSLGSALSRNSSMGLGLGVSRQPSLQALSRQNSLQTLGLSKQPSQEVSGVVINPDCDSKLLARTLSSLTKPLWQVLGLFGLTRSESDTLLERAASEVRHVSDRDA